MDMRHIREFVALAESLSFNKTAASFFISKSALSKHIKSLSSELGVSLFAKSGSGVELTQAGRIFFADCIYVLDAWDNALAHVKSAAAEMPSTVNIGCPNAVIRDLTDRLIDYMDSKHPEVKAMITEIRPRDASSALKSGLLDALIGIGADIDDPAFDRTHLFDDRFFAVVSNNHPLAKLDSIEREELEGCKLLLPSIDNMFGSKEFLAKFIPKSMPLSACRRYQSFDALLLWVINGDYVGFSAGYKMNQYGGDVTFVPISDAETTLSIDVYWAKDIADATRDNLEEAFSHVRTAFIYDMPSKIH